MNILVLCFALSPGPVHFVAFEGCVECEESLLLLRGGDGGKTKQANPGLDAPLRGMEAHSCTPKFTHTGGVPRKAAAVDSEPKKQHRRSRK